MPVLVVVIFAAAALTWSRTRGKRTTYPPPFPCIVTAKTGWLTAVTEDAMLRLEWGDGKGLVSFSELDEPVDFKPRSEAEVRALALEVLQPISTPIRSSSPGRISLFAGCDGVGAQWRGEANHVMPSYEQCLRPFSETRPDCLWRVFKERGEEHDEAPGAVGDRIRAEALAAGVVLPPPRAPAAPYPMRYGLRGGPPSLLDRVIDKVSPPPPPPSDDVF